jgi:cytochrome P450
MAGQRVYLTIEPENIKAILATQFKVWKITPRGTRGKSGYPGPGIVTTNGAAWAHSRELLRPNFVRAQVCDLAMTFRPHVSAFIAALPKDGSTVDLGPIFHRLTMDTAIDLLFGVSTDWLTSGDDGGFAEAVKTVNDNFTRAEQLGGLAQYIPTGKKAKKAIKYIQCVVDAQVDRALANKSTMSKRSDDDTGRYIFLDELARRTEDRFRIRSELFNVLIAGRDATACLLTNLWFILSTRPDIWATLQSEVATLDGIEPSMEQIKHLAYVRAVVNESLRMHPVASFNMREA